MLNRETAKNKYVEIAREIVLKNIDQNKRLKK